MFNEFHLSYTTQIRVRYVDTDKMGIVYNGNYFMYFEVGRTELMRHFGLPYTVFENAGYLLPLTEAKAEYKIPAEYDDLLDINANIHVQYSPIITFKYNISRADSTIAIGHTKHTFIDAKTKKPVKPPEMFFKTLQEVILNSKSRGG